ncbi:hypothetical protein JYK00_01125 [Thermosipho ferrireducens]|uniref:CRISPR type III-associated protein domain-containing protein n=1 Tax=Thermosipho ferrireducens TaxID=2571116 RepID=A0ABX7S6G1_9BACT|nr:RAMP superfamily CRISPR-associated protein [Thermosipho ferrireducens]QTA38172.1 hypothetical protein JYK00_01125 [Thermosipho ferrireducens]
MSENQKVKNNLVKELKIFALTMDPVYIGTGGYTIGRVDNTIVREPITRIPKIPGSSLAGVWRYYVALKLHEFLKEEYRISKRKRKDKDIEEIFSQKKKWVLFEGNRYIGIKCAGQDDKPQLNFDDSQFEQKAHCGHCIVCKSFGFSKKDLSWQGLLFFSDLNIFLFPVHTMYGVKWITTASKLKELGIQTDSPGKEKVLANGVDNQHINLGWLYLEIEREHNIDCELLNKNFGSLVQSEDQSKSVFQDEDIIVVPENLISQIINSNLEVRTSVSIDPITGAAKEGALFTSEAIPRGTVLYGNIRIFDKSQFNGINDKLKDLPAKEDIEEALKDSKHFFETLGIGGMTTRGFGRIKIELSDSNDDSETEGDSKGGDS